MPISVDKDLRNKITGHFPEDHSTRVYSSHFLQLKLAKLSRILREVWNFTKMLRKTLIVVLATACLINGIRCDGAHGHAHSDGEATVEDAPASPPPAAAAASATASSKTPETGSSDGGYASIINLITQNPGLASTLAQNPTLAAAAANYLRRSPGGYDLPAPPIRTPPPPGIPGGFGGIPFGFGKGFNLNVDAGAGIGGGYGGYYPLFEKAIVVVGGGILILVLLAFLQGSISSGGFIHNLFGGFSNAVSGAVNVDVGPFHKSAAGAAALNVNNDRIGVGNNRLNDPQFNARVQQGIDRRF